MANENRISQEGLFPLILHRTCKWLFFLPLFFLFTSPACGEDYFFPMGKKNVDIAELEALFDQKNSYRNPHSVCVYIYDIVQRNTEKTSESQELSRKIELFFESCDGGILPFDDYLHFLSDKALFYQLKNDECRILEILRRFPLEHPYVFDDIHGAAEVKRDTISSILINSFERGFFRRPIVIFLSSFDVFSWTERIWGLFLLPVFAIKFNPYCFYYWIWLVLTIVFLVVVAYGIFKLIKITIARFKKSAKIRN